MPTNGEDKRLLDLLEQQPLLRQRGFEWACEAPYGIAISRNDHLIGIWRFDGTEFAWTPAAYSMPKHRVPTAADALKYTLVVLSVQH